MDEIDDRNVVDVNLLEVGIRYSMYINLTEMDDFLFLFIFFNTVHFFIQSRMCEFSLIAENDFIAHKILYRKKRHINFHISSYLKREFKLVFSS